MVRKRTHCNSPWLAAGRGAGHAEQLYLLMSAKGSGAKDMGAGFKAAIVGVGSTNFAELHRSPEIPRTAHSLAIDAFRAALLDSGLDKTAVDGLICVRISSYQQVAAEIGLPEVRMAYSLEGTGRMAGVAVQQAVSAIATGKAKTVAILYGNNGRSAGDKYGGKFDPHSPAAYDAMYGMTSPGAYVSMMYRRHQYEYGTPPDGLAALAINNRRNGALNEAAVFRKPISRDDYYASPFVAEPLRLLDYCMINDVGVCLIVAAADMARHLKRPPVHVLASATAGSFSAHYTSRDYFYSACQAVAHEIRSQSKITHRDVDCAQIYDNFTPTILFSLEGFGFCPRGASGHWVQDGRIELNGELPINTSGGHTAEGYMQGFGLLAESVRQIQGQAGKHQVENCELVQYICASPIVSSILFSR
ncbi:MAG: thiolase family protein [Betaproteobacteria bacterium]|nr:thiolase family protein [Betaproteobacteria bacterium]